MTATRQVTCASCQKPLLVEPLAAQATCPHCATVLNIHPVEGKKPTPPVVKAISGVVGISVFITVLVVFAVIGDIIWNVLH